MNNQPLFKAIDVECHQNIHIAQLHAFFNTNADLSPLLVILWDTSPRFNADVGQLGKNVSLKAGPHLNFLCLHFSQYFPYRFFTVFFPPQKVSTRLSGLRHRSARSARNDPAA
jgi:hypothetical protein